jgi:hypothetical protein
MRTLKDRTTLLYKFSLTDYVPETHWNTSRDFKLEENLNKQNFKIEDNLVKYNITMPDAPKFILWDIPQYKK